MGQNNHHHHHSKKAKMQLDGFAPHTAGRRSKFIHAPPMLSSAPVATTSSMPTTTTTSSSSNGSPGHHHHHQSRRKDRSIMRGAEIIRQQIRQQLMNNDNQNTSSVAEQQGHPLPFVTDDEFSDIWLNQTPTFLKDLTGRGDDNDNMDDGHHIRHDIVPVADQTSMLSFASRGDASEWAELSTIDFDEPFPRGGTPPPLTPVHSAPDGGEESDSSITFIGRDRSLKLKTPRSAPVTPTPAHEDQGDNDHFDFIGCDYNHLHTRTAPTSDDVHFEADFGDVLTSVESNINPPKVVSPELSPPKKNQREKRTEHLDKRSGGAAKSRRKNSKVTDESSRSLDILCSVVVTSEPTADLRHGAHDLVDHSCAVPSPLATEQTLLQADPAYRHAQNAGFLWQSLVGQQVRFPNHWWKEARSPPLGVTSEVVLPKWEYYGKYLIKANKTMKKLIRNRGAPGRILLHVIVLDLVTRQPVRDLAVGCFHPSARGIRQGDKADPRLEESRALWLAVRKRTDTISVVDPLLSRDRVWESACRSPLGPEHRVTNTNVRAVFGEEPPLETIFVPESELYERMASSVDRPGKVPPMILLQEFVFS